MPRCEQTLKAIVEALSGTEGGYRSPSILSVDSRIKKWPSVCRKWWKRLKSRELNQVDEQVLTSAFASIHDLVGVRVEVAYHDWIRQPVLRVIRALLSQHGIHADIRKGGLKDDNYLDNDKMGYRAYHFHVKVSQPTSLAKAEECAYIGEIQLLTSLQKVWAVRMHPLVYDRFKGKEIPTSIENMMLGLSAAIYSADRQFITLRNYVEPWESSSEA